MSRILVYTHQHESSADCESTKAMLRARNLDFEERDMSNNSKMSACLRAAGYNRFPVVIAFDSVWCGHHPDKLVALTPNPPVRGGRPRRQRSA